MSTLWDVTEPDQRPLLLVDVDGVISLWGFDPAAPPPGLYTSVDGIPHYLSLGAAQCLRRLAARFDCVWCTGWKDRADTHLPHLLGLPDGWPHLVFSPAEEAFQHWKLEAIEAFAGPHRPVAWIDDDFDPSCKTWQDIRPGPTLLVPTQPSSGLTPYHVEQLLSWVRSLTERA